MALDHAYAAGEVRGGAAKPVPIDAPQVQQIFGSAIAARPILPSHFRLYFISDSDTLTPASQQQYRDVFADIKRRAVYQVEVVGHTDTLGDKSYNQQLSLQRAALALRDQLVRDGLAPAAITVAGRGQLDPAVKTGDQVSDRATAGSRSPFADPPRGSRPDPAHRQQRDVVGLLGVADEAADILAHRTTIDLAPHPGADRAPRGRDAPLV